jgi:sigma-B regulation protein RsbU (phosphoserine phosphatase)
MEKGVLRYINAGHNPPIIVTKDGEISRLEPTGFCLGMFPSVTYEVKEMTLEKGDLAVLYTDGITDARNRDNAEFGEENLVGLLKKSAKKPATEIVDKVCSELSAFTAGVEPFDDMTVIVLKRTG